MNNSKLEAAAYCLLEKLVDLSPAEQQRALAFECKDDHTLFERCISLLKYQTSDTQLENMVYGDLTEENSCGHLEGSIGGYEIIKKIGSGGTAEVFLATREGDVRREPIALKLVHQRGYTRELADRFAQEQSILEHLSHPNIAKFIERGTTTEGDSFFVMEFVQGKSITEHCKEKKLSLNDRLKLFLSVCTAVSAAHKALILHRDIKPSNILVSKEGIPKLLDFGIAKLIDNERDDDTALTEFFSPMTPQYASPEQLKQKTLSYASDQYSLGVLLYELITGELPFESVEDKLMYITCGKNIARPSQRVENKIHLRRNRRSLPICIDSALDAIVMKAIHHRPEKRYESVAKLEQDIKRYLRNEPVLAQKLNIADKVRDFFGLREPIVNAARSFFRMSESTRTKA